MAGASLVTGSGEDRHSFLIYAQLPHVTHVATLYTSGCAIAERNLANLIGVGMMACMLKISRLSRYDSSCVAVCLRHMYVHLCVSGA